MKRGLFGAIFLKANKIIIVLIFGFAVLHFLLMAGLFLFASVLAIGTEDNHTLAGLAALFFAKLLLSTSMVLAAPVLVMYFVIGLLFQDIGNFWDSSAFSFVPDDLFLVPFFLNSLLWGVAIYFVGKKFSKIMR